MTSYGVLVRLGASYDVLWPRRASYGLVGRLMSSYGVLRRLMTPIDFLWHLKASYGVVGRRRASYSVVGRLMASSEVSSLQSVPSAHFLTDQ